VATRAKATAVRRKATRRRVRRTFGDLEVFGFGGDLEISNQLKSPVSKSPNLQVRYFFGIVQK
jgi:hypothetical protein